MRVWKEGSIKITLKDQSEISAMREGGKILGTVLSELESMVKPGISTLQLNAAAEKMMTQFKVEPSFKGFQGFPATLCTCINEEVVHGIPSNRTLNEGEIITIDCGVFHKGFHTDSAITIPVGKIDDETKRFIEVTQKALDKAIQIARPGIKINEISSIIDSTVTNEGYSIIYDLTGHGIGKELHEDPIIPNFRNNQDPGPILQPGMTIAIEPIISMGRPEIRILRDNWTYVTADSSLSAQIEHTIAITEDGSEILTLRPQINKKKTVALKQNPV